jgi:hypothetical protein
LSPLIYTGLFHLLTKSRPATLPFQFREVVSIMHSTVITLLTLLTLHQHRSSIYPTPESLAQLTRTKHPTSSPDHLLPIITTKSSTCNTLIALETGYLLADTIILIRLISSIHHDTKIFRKGNPPSPSTCTSTSTSHSHRQPLPSKSTIPNAITPQTLTPNHSIPTLLTHHLILLPPLLLLNLYTTLQLDRGILILTTFLLMNASTPLSSLRRRQHHYSCSHSQCHRRAKAMLTLFSAIYWAVFATCRLGLLWWVVSVYARQRDMLLNGQGGTIWTLFWGLRWPCRLGMAILGAANAWWLGKGLRRMVKKGLDM